MTLDAHLCRATIYQLPIKQHVPWLEPTDLERLPCVTWRHVLPFSPIRLFAPIASRPRDRTRFAVPISAASPLEPATHAPTLIPAACTGSWFRFIDRAGSGKVGWRGASALR